VRSLVPAILPHLSRSGGNHGRAEPLRGPCHHLALGPRLCTRFESKNSPRDAPPNRSWRVDETYVKVAGNWAYLYRAIDSAGETIEFMLSPKRDLIAAKLFLRLALSGSRPRPRVINVDRHAAYASAVAELKQTGELGRHCRCRTPHYLNNIIEQGHRFIKKRITANLGFRSAEGARRTIERYEAMHAIRKDQVRWVAKGDPVAQHQFIQTIFGIAA
jgi:transposase, IS6 family